MSASPENAASWKVVTHTEYVKLPFDLRTKLGPELEAIRQRELEEPFYRGETLIRPEECDTTSSDSDGEDDAPAPSSSPPSSVPSSSSPARAPTTPVRTKPLSARSPIVSPALSIWSRSLHSPAGSPLSPGHPLGRHHPYPPLLRRYGFGPKLPQLTFLPLRPRPLLQVRPQLSAVTRAQLKRLDFRVFDWNQETTPWLDREQRVTAVLLGPPTDTRTWDEHVIDATTALGVAENALDRAHLDEEALHDGVRFGGPRGPRPQNHKNTLENLVELVKLRQNNSVRAITQFQNDMYRQFFPKMHARGLRTVEQLRGWDSGLHLPFDTAPIDENRVTAWTSVEYQFGASSTPERCDDLDSVHGVRALTVVGTYNTSYTYSGDIIFWGSKFVASFPVGSTFIFPAWWMPYSFTMVDRDESHFVIMQSMAAGVDRFVENGMLSDAQTDQEARTVAIANQLDEVLDLFSTVAEL